MSGIENNDYSQILKLGRHGEKIDLNTLDGKGVQKNDKNKSVFDKFDSNKDGKLDENEVKNLKDYLLETAGDDGVLSKREIKLSKQFGNRRADAKTLYTALNDIYIQQKNADNLKLTVPVLQDTPAAPDTPLDMPVSDAIPQEVVGQGEFNELPVIEVKAARPERELTPQNALQDLFGDKRKASVKIDGSATGLGRAYQGEVRLANGEILEDGKFPQNIRITLPPAYGANATMKLTLIDEENGIYETSAKDRNFQIVVDDNGNVSIQSVNVDELQSKLDANLDTYRQLEAEKAAETAAKEAEDAAKQAEEEQKRVNYNMQKAQVEAERLADDLYGASNDYGAVGAGTSFDRHFAKLNKDNICMVLSQYDKQHPDESLIDTICSEVTSSKKDRKAALNKILDNLTAAAREAGVPEADITKARGEFSASMEAEFKKFGLINPSNMEKSANYLRGLISAKELGSVDMDESEAMESITGAAAETYQTARETFDTARAEEGWAAKTGDTVLGWFGCTTKDDMETKLGAYKADVEKLQNAKSEAEFKQTFEDVFGVPFDSKRVAAYEAARSDYAVAYGAKEQMDIYGNLSLKGASSAVDYESLKNECCSVTGMKPEELDKLIAQMSSEQPGVDNKKLLNQFIDNLYDASEQTYNNIAHGRDLEQIGADVDRIRQSAFGTRDIVKDVIEYNTNQQMTDMAVEAAGEIALTIALQAIPGAGQAALLKLSASTAKWGARGIKIARYTDKAAAALKKADTAINTGKTVNITRAKKAVAGAATAGTATFAVDMSNGKSVKEALNKALMNASFAGAGSLTGELGPIISKTYGIEGKLANEIAQEITERAMDVGTSAAITAAFNGGYTENDAFLDFATGVIMSRLGRGFKGKELKTSAPETSTPETSGNLNGRDPIADGEVARNINQQHLNANERKMVSDALEDVPTPEEVEAYAKDIAYKAPTPEEQVALDAHQAQVKQDYDDAHQLANNADIKEQKVDKAPVKGNIDKLNDELKGIDGSIKRLEQQIAGAKRFGKDTSKLEAQLNNLKEKRASKKAEIDNLQQNADISAEKEQEVTPENNKSDTSANAGQSRPLNAGDRLAMIQIGNNINIAKSLSDLEKAQQLLNELPDCPQKQILQKQLDSKSQEINAVREGIEAQEQTPVNTGSNKVNTNNQNAKNFENLSDEISSTFGYNTQEFLSKKLDVNQTIHIDKGDTHYAIKNVNGKIEIISKTPRVEVNFDIPMSNRTPAGQKYPGISMNDALTPQQKEVYNSSYQAFIDTKNKKITHKHSNTLTTDNYLHGTGFDSLLRKGGILDNGLIPREISGKSAAHYSDGSVPDTLTPMCTDVWDVRENISVKDYFDARSQHWRNEGESNFLPSSSQMSSNFILVLDTKSMDERIVQNSFEVNNNGKSVLFENGNMSRGHNYPTHRAIPIGAPANSIEKIIVDTRFIDKKMIKQLKTKIVEKGLDIKLYDLQGKEI